MSRLENLTLGDLPETAAADDALTRICIAWTRVDVLPGARVVSRRRASPLADERAEGLQALGVFEGFR